MQVRTAIRIESHDLARMNRADEALNLVGLSVLMKENKDVRGEDRDPLVRAIGHLRGNSFTTEELDIIVEGIRLKADELKQDREVFLDERTQSGFMNAVRANADLAVRLIEQFRDDVRDDLEAVSK